MSAPGWSRTVTEAVFTRPGLRAAMLAVADVTHDRWASFALLLSVAAILAPILLLRGIESGALLAMRRQFETDPHSREILVIGSYDLPGELVETLRRHPDTGFVVVEPRYLNSAYTVRHEDGKGRLVELPFLATAPGDPVLQGVSVPDGYDEVVLTHRAAEKLAAAPGARLRITVWRGAGGGGRRERLRWSASVVAVLPEERDYGERGYASVDLLRAVELWREGQIELRPDGSLPPPDQLPAAPAARLRLYAKDIDAAPRLRRFLEDHGIEAKLREERIATLLALAHRLDRLLALLATLVAAGLVAVLLVTGWQRVLIRRRQLAVLRLLAFRRWELAVYPVIQTVVLTVTGSIVGLGAVLLVGPTVGRAIQASFDLEGASFVLGTTEMAVVPIAVGVLAGASALVGGLFAARVEPAEVLHDD